MSAPFADWFSRALVAAFSCLPAGILLAPTTLDAAPQERIAVLEFDVLPGLEIDRLYFSDKVRHAVGEKAPQLFVMTRESAEVLLRSQGKALADCQGECEVETGKKLGVDYIVSGRITRVGSRLILTLCLHSTGEARLLRAAEAVGKNLDELFDGSAKAIDELLSALPLATKDRPLGQRTASASTDAAEVLVTKSRVVEPKSGLEFVEIPAGTFQYRGERSVLFVKAFSLGSTAVTVDAYAHCVAAGPCSEPNVGSGCNWKTDRTSHPVTCVSWHQATAFCIWIGGRLPTEQEREYVASGGSQGGEFPWGNEPPGVRACWNGEGSDAGKGNNRTTCAVGSHKAGDSKWGLHDLAGNVWEWTSGDDDSSYRPIRGGSWFIDRAEGLRARFRHVLEPSTRNTDVGFRCALSRQTTGIAAPP